MHPKPSRLTQQVNSRLRGKLNYENNTGDRPGVDARTRRQRD
jgi:hypothetical protein